MCSFIGLFGSGKELKEIDYEYDIQEIIDVKGGDSYSCTIIGENKINQFYWDDQIHLEDIYDEIDDYGHYGILFFSRMIPEMEEEDIYDHQPYVKDDELIVIHGTIGEDKKIQKEFNLPKLQVDTDIFKYLDFKKACEVTERYDGKISALSLKYNSDGVLFKGFHNGLGLFRGQVGKVVFFTNIHPVNYLDKYNWVIHSKLKPGYLHEYQGQFTFKSGKNVKTHLHENKIESVINNKVRLVALYSGGLDITCSVQRAIYDIEEKNEVVESIDLIYFYWNTRASYAEIDVGKYFKNYLNEKGYNAEFTIYNIEDFFKTYEIILDKRFRLSDKNASGARSIEAETAYSYVPFRNTLFLVIAAGIFEEKYPHDNVRFVIGANLTEGMIYNDNSESFIRTMNYLVKVGGQKTTYFEVIAPYMNMTKRKMLEDALDKGFDIDFSMSCYFPAEDGSPCGECGSCILREKAIRLAKETNR